MPEPHPDEIKRAARCLREGGLVAFPTETVYGLGANALIGTAVARIFKAKHRPEFNPLIVHLANVEAVEAFCDVPASARRLADAFWPGALTLVLARKATCPVSELVSAGLSTLAVRVPAHPVAQALLSAADVPVAAPSANRSGHVSATRAEHVAADLGGQVDYILDAGATPLGLESTIVSVRASAENGRDDEVVLLRVGAIDRASIETVLGRAITKMVDIRDGRAQAPGQLESHYAPRAALRLNATRVERGEALLAFGERIPNHDGPVLNLSPGGNLTEAAANLFAYLRDLDALGTGRIAVMPIPMGGLGDAINDRLVRAAAPRPQSMGG